MRAMACAAVALMFAFTAACNDRDRDDTATRVDTAVEDAGDEAREGGEDVENTAEGAAEKVEGTAEDAAEGAKDAAEEVTGDYSYERREEFRRDVSERLRRMDEELAELSRSTGEGADQARKDAVAAARDARQAIAADVDRLGEATESNWNELKDNVSAGLDSAERQLRALRPDAKPMGGTSGPN